MSESGSSVLPGAGDYGSTPIGRLDRRWLDSPRGRRVLLLLFAAVFAGASVKFVRNMHTLEDSPFRGQKRKAALGRWLADPPALVNGENPYGFGHWFPNPPVVLLLITPLSYVPVSVAAAAWLLAKLAAVVCAALLMLEAARRRELAVPVGVTAVATLWALRPVVSDIQHGNLNLFVLLELAVVWYLFVRGRDFTAGVVLALAVATKVTPALLVVYFLYKRAWRVVAGSAVGGVLFVVLVPGLILGFGRNNELLAGWFDVMVVPFAFEGFVTVEPMNQSLPGLFMKWFAAPDLLAMQWPNASFGGWAAMLREWFPVELTGVPRVRCTGNPMIDAALMSLSHAQAAAVPLRTGVPLMARPDSPLGAAVVRGASLVVLAALAWLCRSRCAQRRDPRLLLELALVLIAMLLLSERTWKQHMVTLWIVFLANWLVVLCGAASPRLRGLLVGGLVLQFVLLQARGTVLEFAGVFTVALLLCFLQTALTLRMLNRAAGESVA